MDCNNKNETMICPQCGKEFVREAINQWYCSKECQRTSKRNRDKIERQLRKRTRKEAYEERLKEKDKFLSEAMEHHMTYGKYRQMLYCEELQRKREEENNKK